jgi:hypothetical protein
MNSEAKQCEAFADMVLPASAQPPWDPIQVQEMRRAFYAGCWSMFCECKELARNISPDTILHLWSIEVEMRAFQNDMTEGKA